MLGGAKSLETEGQGEAEEAEVGNQERILSGSHRGTRNATSLGAINQRHSLGWETINSDRAK